MVSPSVGLVKLTVGGVLSPVLVELSTVKVTILEDETLPEGSLEMAVSL